LEGLILPLGEWAFLLNDRYLGFELLFLFFEKEIVYEDRFGLSDIH